MSTEDACKLFVAGLPESVTEDVLRQLFEATGGTVTNVSLPRDRMTGRPRGFGFVTLATPEEAESARGSLDGSLQAGRPISVRPFQSEPPRRGEPRSEGAGPGSGAAAGGADRTLYVGNLPYDTSQPDVEALFKDNNAGPVVRVHLPVGPDGRLRGFGFVTLGSAEAANAAIAALRNVEMNGRRLIINVAHPRGERGDRPERSERPRPPRRDEGGGFEPRDRFEPPAMPPPDMEPRRAEGRRRATKPERPDTDSRRKKASRGKGEDVKRRGRSWDDWEDDE